MGKSNWNNPKFPNNAPIKGNFTYEERVWLNPQKLTKNKFSKLCFTQNHFLFLFQLLNFFEIVSVFHLFSCGQCNNPTLKKLHNWLLRKNSNWLDLKHLIYIFNQKNLRFSERFGLGTITNESVSYLDVST